IPAQSVLVKQCEQLLDAASQDLPHIEITVETVRLDDGRRRFADLDIKGNRDWTRYEALLCHVIALNLDHPRLQQRFLKLLDLTEWSLRATVHNAAKSTRFKTGPIWGEAVRLYGGILSHAILRLPCVAILSSMQRDFIPGGHYAQGLPIRKHLLARVRRTPESHFALLTLLEDYRWYADDGGDIATKLSLVQQSWNSGIYILRVRALWLLQSMRQAVEETCPQELPRIRAMLEGFETDNILVNSTLLETLASYGGLELVVSV